MWVDSRTLIAHNRRRAVEHDHVAPADTPTMLAGVACGICPSSVIDLYACSAAAKAARPIIIIDHGDHHRYGLFNSDLIRRMFACVCFMFGAVAMPQRDQGDSQYF